MDPLLLMFLGALKKAFSIRIMRWCSSQPTSPLCTASCRAQNFLTGSLNLSCHTQVCKTMRSRPYANRMLSET